MSVIPGVASDNGVQLILPLASCLDKSSARQLRTQLFPENFIALKLPYLFVPHDACSMVFLDEGLKFGQGFCPRSHPLNMGLVPRKQTYPVMITLLEKGCHKQ